MSSKLVIVGLVWYDLILSSSIKKNSTNEFIQCVEFLNFHISRFEG